MRTPALIATTLLLTLTACGGGDGAPTTGPDPKPPVLAFPNPSPAGTPIGVPTQKVIGAAGGSVSTPDGAVSLDIPAGALSGDQTVGIEEITTTSPARFGRSFRLTPEGTPFAKPVRVTFRYTDADLRGTSLQAVRVNFQTPEGYWTPAPVQRIDTAARTVTVETTHFSIWASLPDAVLFPQVGEVRVGQSLELEVVMCDELPEGFENPYAFPVTACEVSPVLANLARNWAVNGVAGGSASAGAVVSNVPGRAVYTAPAKKPTPNSVAVSMQYNSGGAQFTLVSEVNVLEAPAWHGTVTYTETGSRAWVMRDGFEGSGLESAKQTHTFNVVGVKEVDAYNTTLLLEQVSFAEYVDKGHMEKKIYEICQAFGPKILRHHFVYGRDFSMGGSLKATHEARLNLMGDRYSLSILPKDVEMTGQDVTTDIYKDGCAGTTNDRSNSKPKKYPAAPETLRIEGTLDPAHSNTLMGGYDGKGEIFVQPTTYTVNWRLTRGQ